MKAEIRNFRGIREADVDLSRIALITGKNYSGKTSIARAVASAITRESVFDGLKKAQVAKLVHNDATTSSIKIITDSGDIIQHLPDNDITTIKNPTAHMSLYAAGIRSILNEDTKTKSKFFIELLGASPTKEDLESELKKHFIEDDIWSKVESEGWDYAHSSYTSLTKEKKGAWKEITKEAYGKVKANSWSPLANTSLEPVNPDVLTDDISKLEVEYQEAIKQNALSDYQTEDLKNKVTEEDSIIKQNESLNTKLQTLLKEIEIKTQELRDIRTSETKVYKCPECKTELILSNGTLQQNTEQQTASPQRRQALEQELSSLNHKLNSIRIEISSLATKLNEISNAKSRLAEVSLSPQIKTNPEEIRANIEDKKQLLNDYYKCKRALEIHTEIETCTIISEILSETGIRKNKLKTIIEDFNTNILKPLSIDFGVKQITIDPDMNIYYGENIYYTKDPDYLLSKCEQFMVRTVLQIAIAKLDKSNLIIIDNADELNSPEDKARLFNMVIRSNIPTLICMAMQPDEKVPNLEESGVGITYVVENGILNKAQ